MTETYIYRRTGRFVVGARLLLATLALTAATYQSAEAEIVEGAVLLRQGFTTVDLRATNQVLAAPHFALYLSWRRCILTTIPAVLRLEPPDSETLIHFTQLDCNADLNTLRASLARELGLPQAVRVARLLNANVANILRDTWASGALRKASTQTRSPDPDPPAPTNWKLHRTAKGCIAQYTIPQSNQVEMFVTWDETGYYLILRRHRIEQTPEGNLYDVTLTAPDGPYRARKSLISSTEDNIVWLKLRLDEVDRFHLKNATHLSIRPLALKSAPPEGFDVSPITEDVMRSLSQCLPRRS